MWETLTLSHKGSKEVKRNKLTLVKRQYEMFTMEDNVTAQSMIDRLQTIPYTPRSLGTAISQYEINY